MRRAAPLQRSRSQVLFSYLPGAVFIHETGLTVRSRGIRGEGLGDLINKPVLLNEIDRYLEKWPEDEREGFPRGLARHRAEISIETPEQVRYDIWPLVFECTNEACKRIRTFREIRDVTAGARCKFCKSSLRQLRYFAAHSCGEIRRMYVPKCPSHGYDHVYFEDTGSFLTAIFRCRACGGQVLRRTAQTPCGCGKFAAEDGRSMMRAYTVRDTRTFFAHYVPIINFQSHTFKRFQEHPRRGQIAVASYLDLVGSIGEALTEVESTTEERMSPEKWAVREQEYITMGMSHVEIDALRKAIGPRERGIGATGDLSGGLLEVGERRPVIERAMLFDREHAPEHSLETARTEAEARGQVAAVARLDAARQQASAMGIQSVHVTWKFPIALAAFGYTRGTTDPQSSAIHAFRRDQHEGKVPIFAVATETEAVIITISATAVVNWLVHRGSITGPIPSDESAARRTILELFASQEIEPGPVGDVETLVHSMAHCMLRALGEGQVGFAESSLAEWIVPETLTIGIYANSLNSDTLGAFWTLINNRPLNWLMSSIEGVRTCENDPLCRQRGPWACERCLFVSFGCQRFNERLSRRLLGEFWRNV